MKPTTDPPVQQEEGSGARMLDTKLLQHLLEQAGFDDQETHVVQILISRCSTRATVSPEVGAQLLPWQQGILADWDIVGMNHYHKDLERWLFVAMTNGVHCIRAESVDPDALFAVLAMAAQVHASSPPQVKE